MRGKKCAVRICLLSAVIFLGFILWNWTQCKECEIHYTPGYAKIDLLPYVEKLEKGTLTAEGYDVLYCQTGLSKIAADTLLLENRENELLQVQERFFADVETECECEFFLFRETMNVAHTTADEGNIIPVLEDGDILLTFNSHFLGWRNYHAGIVIDAQEGLMLEALTIGRDSSVLSLDSWEERPSFAVMRLRDGTKEERAKVAEYAKEHLADIPYRLSAGMSDGMHRVSRLDPSKADTELNAEDMKYMDEESVRGTQCAHLIWCAYRQFGYDLDGDGGWIVTPKDIYESPLLEVVQVYGMKPE